MEYIKNVSLTYSQYININEIDILHVCIRSLKFKVYPAFTAHLDLD